MRLSLITQSCDNDTGIGRIVRSLAREFVQRNHEVHIIGQVFHAEQEGWRKHQVATVHGSGFLNRLSLHYTVPGVLRKLDCDVSNSFLIGRGSNVVTAQSCHRAGIELLRQYKRENIWQSNFGLFDRLAVSDERRLFQSRETKRIIAVSELIKNQIMQHYNVDPSRIAVVPNGVDIATFESLRKKTDRSSIRRRHNVSEDEVLVLFVGNEFDRKGLQPLIQSIARLRRRKLHLLVIGTGNTRAYQQLATRLGITNRVSFAGKLANPEEIFVASDLFVFPTLYEPFGLVILEAMAAGVPVITSATAGAVEGFQNREHGLFLRDPASGDELTIAIEELLDDTRLRESIVKNAMDAVGRFSWERIADKHLAAYEAVRGMS